MNYITGVKQLVQIATLLIIAGASTYAYSQENLTSESMNPLSTVTSVPFENNTLFNVGPAQSTVNVLNVKPVIPVNLGNWNLINRLVVPLIYTQGQTDIIDDSIYLGAGNPGSFGLGSAFGLADITYQGFITPSKSGRVSWGLGGSLVAPTHTDDRFGTNKWSTGPAVVMFTNLDNWVLGLIAENIWSFAGDSDAPDVNVFSAQVAINYKLQNGWYLTTAPLISANWEESSDNRWTVPLGGGVGRVFKLETMAIAIDAGAYYNVEKPRHSDDWYTQVLVNFLFPKK